MRGKKREKIRESNKIKERKYKARVQSIKEGIFASAKSSFGDYYLSPFAIAINMSNFFVALLSSISGLIGPLSQMFSSRLMERYSRKEIVLKIIFLESLVWLPLILLAILFSEGIIAGFLPVMFFIAFSSYIILSNISTPIWFSWVGDIVDEKYRGRWFSKRSLILGFISIVFALSASLLLDYLKSREQTMLGFAILFSLAFIGRIISWDCLKKQYEPKIKLKDGYYFSFPEFLRKARETNFGRFAIFRAFLSFAGSIFAPLLTIYLLRDLNLSYALYMAITLSGSFVSLFMMEIWGKISDKYGNYKVLYISSIVIPLIPVMWIINPSPVYLILPSIIGGLFWAGFNLAEGNFIYDNVSQEKRGLVVSYYNTINGIGVFLGAGLGAVLIKFLPSSLIKPFFLISIISSIARAVVILWWIPKIKEIRMVKNLDGKGIKNIIFKETKATLTEEVHQLMSIKRYLKVK